VIEKRELRAHLAPWRDAVEFYLIDRGTGRAPSFVGTNVTMEELKEGFAPDAPTFSLSSAHAQALADELWHAGFRPKAATSPDGALHMQGAHLADMRAIAFAKLGLAEKAK
jgi:hypothetical protein